MDPKNAYYGHLVDVVNATKHKEMWRCVATENVGREEWQRTYIELRWRDGTIETVNRWPKHDVSGLFPMMKGGITLPRERPAAMIKQAFNRNNMTFKRTHLKKAIDIGNCTVQSPKPLMPLENRAHWPIYQCWFQDFLCAAALNLLDTDARQEVEGLLNYVPAVYTSIAAQLGIMNHSDARSCVLARYTSSGTALI